jgi:hypothetical protein
MYCSNLFVPKTIFPIKVTKITILRIWKAAHDEGTLLKMPKSTALSENAQFIVKLSRIKAVEILLINRKGNKLLFRK